MFGESNCLKLDCVSETLSRVVSTKRMNNIGKASPESKQESCKFQVHKWMRILQESIGLHISEEKNKKGAK
jgi:hypothetical protein